MKNLENNINVYTRICKALESPRVFGEEYCMDNDSRIYFEEECPSWETQEWNNKSEETILEELDSELYDMMRERTNYFLAKDAVENKKHMLINIGGVKPTYIKPLSVGKHYMEYLRCATNRPAFYYRIPHGDKTSFTHTTQTAEIDIIQLDYFEYIASY